MSQSPSTKRDKETGLGPCLCGCTHFGLSHAFGWWTIVCQECKRKLTGEARSGSHIYVLEHGLADAWNRGESDSKEGVCSRDATNNLDTE